MKVEKTYLEDDHQLKLMVEIEQDVFDKAKYLASKDLSKGVKIPGFRPGKAPYNMVVQYVGEDRIRSAAIEDILDDVYPDIIGDLDEELYSPGQLVDIPSDEPLTFELHVPLQVEVELGEYSSIRIPYEPPTVPQEDIDEFVRGQQLQHATVEEVDTPAAENSLVDTKLTGWIADADPEDEEAQVMTNQPLPVLIKFEDDDDSKEWPFPGFSRQLLGVSAGDTLELVHEYSDDEDVSEDLRGKEVLYHVTVAGVRDRSLPEFNDEFVQSISGYDSAEEYLDFIETSWRERSLREYENSYSEEILDAILEVSSVKYPTMMLEDKVEDRIDQLKASLAGQGFSWEDYLEMQGQDEDELRAEMTEDVKLSLRRGLVLGHILETEELEISPEDVTEEFRRVIDMSFEDEDDPKRREFLSSKDSINLLNSIASRKTTDYVIQFLIALAKGEDVSEFKKAVEEDEEMDDEEVIEEDAEVEAEEDEMVEEEAGDAEPVTDEEMDSAQDAENDGEND